ncbi:MAG: proton-conducting transporter membrane subunit, partial [Thiobacillaceae bacterium]|nr:proton-conducting transporter membrane subunit [Thiobacillaceae bacterium]
MNHIVIAPLLAPLSAGVLLLLLRHLDLRLRRVLSVAALLAQLGLAFALTAHVADGAILTYALGDWPAPYGIVLVADRLAAWMLLTTLLLALFALLAALRGLDAAGRHFHVLFHLQLFGLAGAFLTGDLFNLFVFAEIIVISGAALTANADEPAGVEAAYKYFYISTLAAMFFLLGVGALYAAYGTLNLADLARQIASAPLSPLTLAGLAFLAVTFFIKSAAVPFHFWQPDFHAAAPTAISAMLSSLVVKVGVYGFLRLTTCLLYT